MFKEKFRNEEVIKKIQNDIIAMRYLVFSKKENPHRETFLKFEALASKMLEEFKHTDFSDSDLHMLSQNLSISIKRLKRNIENDLKYEKSDVNSVFEKFKLEKIPLVPILEKEFKLLNALSNKEFDFESVMNINFPILECTNKELGYYALKIIENVNLQEDIGSVQPKLKNLVDSIIRNYNVVPYHNFSHAFSVFQMLAFSYFKSEFKDFVAPFDIFAGLIASLSHDMNHKGVNNAYKVKKKSGKSIVFSEISVLENMHCSKFFHLIQDKNCDITEMFKDNAQKTLFKRLLISSILATDMAKHVKLLEKFTKRVQITKKAQDDPSFLNENKNIIEELILSPKRFDDKRIVLRTIVHACDIGNPCYKFEGYMNWCYLLAQEFHDQTLKEAKNNLEVTEMFKFKDMKTFYNGQLFFSKNLVLPLWKQISLLFSNLTTFPNAILENIKILEEKKENA